MEQGLYGKYRVLKSDTGEEINSFFVLKPDTDPVAIAALQRYAELTPNDQLSEELNCWLETLEMMGAQMPPKCDYCEDIAKVRTTPFLADSGAVMCEYCWNHTRREYKDSHGEDIGKF
ncbi:hypothetical protein MUB24_06260 [Lederbergia sp. NSJ-179]|uniref:hypothetical protein n=1 Tax=Lederbergia sp. NSJ-179 TaxID=2931402 RepID=UPI001FD23596|nr:hypothetical protein [Lederbergia sp. NSJ-179]MCJ7840530.1 hypothetical protein [Lederbergia sp. NSJ-179]